MKVEGDPAAIRAGRRFIEDQVVALGGESVVDDAALVAAELLANALQHGKPPFGVDVKAHGSMIRVEVHDGESRPPIRPTQSVTSNMTGRGLMLVEAASVRWGVMQIPDDGKVVWAEFDPERPANSHSTSATVLIGSWKQPIEDGEVPRYTVVLGDVPTDLLLEAKAHIDNLVREFTMMAATEPAGIPGQHLAQLVRAVVHDFAEARDGIKRQALEAAQRHEPRTRLELRLPLSAANAGRAYLEALNEADAYARAARLLTLETPPAHRLFRRWYVEALVQQLRELASGGAPAPVRSFETVMLEEIERLATLQRITDRAARLQRVTAALASTRTPEDVAAVVVSEGVSALGASGGGLVVPSGDGVHIAVPGAVGYVGELMDALREERLDAPLPAATVLRTGEAVWLESREERDRLFPALRGFEAATVSMCSVPLLVGDATLGALRFSFTTRRLFDEDERAFVLALAAQTAQTLLRTETYAAERQASLALQRALLPDETAPIPGWQVVSYYSPAGQQEAGGDFYDVLPLGENRVVAVVGDVMGRGVQAAAAMAQVRTMIRAYAVDDPTPDSVFTKVDTFFQQADLTQFVTVLYFLIETDTGTIHVANAGHLPPIIIDPDGSRIAQVPVGPPLGIGDERRTMTSLKVASGASLLVITDGLVERRGEDIDVGIERILTATDGEHFPTLDQLVKRVIDATTPTTHDDDVTALALRRD